MCSRSSQLAWGQDAVTEGAKFPDTCGGEDTWDSDNRWTNMERVPEGVARFHPEPEHKKDNFCERFHRD
jgi:hypothetical protein